MEFETLQYSEEGTVGVLTIMRPQALNALNRQVLEDLRTFLIKFQDRKQIRVLIITGSGEKAFVAGADIKEMENVNSNEAQVFAENGQNIFQQLEQLHVPTVAAVNGFALGGGLELALSCDFIVASKNAKLGLPEVSLGLIPGYGGTQRLARICGKSVARLMTFTGEMYSAEQCAQWGLVAMVTPIAELLPTCMKIAQKISQRSPIAVRLAKESILTGVELSQSEGMKIEARNFQRAFQSADKKEGVLAFIEKRMPVFVGE